MTSHLQRAYTDLNDLTLSYQKMSLEKKSLEKKLIDANSNLQVLQNRVMELEKENTETTSDVISSLSSVKIEKESAVQQVQTLHRDLQERNTYIIALHMHLLTAQEEIGNLKNRLQTAEEAKQKMLTQLNLVAMNYDHQRHESIKLSEKLEFHKNDLEKYSEMKINYRELQFDNQKLKHDRDEVINELNSLKEWVEVFKARYDIVERDSEQTRESHETLAADCYHLRQRVDELELKLGSHRRELEATKKRYSEAIEEIKQLKEQRDIFSENRKDLMMERDQAIAELDQSIQRYTEILKNRDDTITRQTLHCKHYEDKYENACTELQWLQKELTSKEHDFEELRKAKLERELSTETTICPQMSELDISGQTLNKFDDELIASGDSSPGESQDSEDSFDWKYRKTTNIIESLKKRVGNNRKEEQPQSPPSSLKLPGFDSPDRILEELVPQKKALSPEAQKCLSMDRNNLFKVTPSHCSLAYMFESIANSFNDANLGLYPTSSNSVPTSLPNGNATYPRKALSDSEVPTKDVSHQLETKAKSQTLNSYMNKPPYYQSLSCGTSNSRPVLTKSRTQPSPEIMSRDVFTFLTGFPKETEDFDLEKALNSPSFQNPFRKRAMAIKLKDNERPRSCSAPSEPNTL